MITESLLRRDSGYALSDIFTSWHFLYVTLRDVIIFLDKFTSPQN